MRFDLDKIVRVYEQALYLRARRSELIASNLANADTPNYKARDLDFRAVMRQVGGMSGPERPKITHPGHILPGGGDARSAEPLYRQPLQPSLDGNTVDAQVEKAEFAENALRYQATLQFLGGKLKSMITAVKGGR